MSKITSIATAVPQHRHLQTDLYKFADKVYSKDEQDSRKLKFLYRHSGIESRYSVIPDFSSDNNSRKMFPPTDDLEPFPSLEDRMECYAENAVPLSVEAIQLCINGKIEAQQITHLITVSCTGMSAPGLDLQVMEAMHLPVNLFRTSINFMGCYAAIHAMKLADNICQLQMEANVVIVCTELCTLHFQKEISADNLTASLLFADGSAAILVQHNDVDARGLVLDNFYAQVLYDGKKDMAWKLSSSGFLMTLTGYVPKLIKQDFSNLLNNAIKDAGIEKKHITYWCIHPGGTKILEAIAESVDISKEALQYSYDVLRDYGNMSSPTILFVLQKILAEMESDDKQIGCLFGAAFGPGLTMETFTAHYA